LSRRLPTKRIDQAEFEDSLRISGSILRAQSALEGLIADHAVARSSHDATTLDLLVRLQLSPQHQLRGVELCRQLDLSKSHVSRVVDRAESEGLVQRQADPDDRRAQQIVLTETGEEALLGFAPHLVEVLNQTLNSSLTEDEGDTLIGLLARVTESVHGFCGQQDSARPV
jgi:DNA-binding MarR family transcriptional regulator